MANDKFEFASILLGFLPGDQAFPFHTCTKPNAREPEVCDSDLECICLVEDPRFPGQAELRILKPYTVETDGLTLYGWTDGDQWWDHCDRPIHGDRERVVAWRAL